MSASASSLASSESSDLLSRADSATTGSSLSDDSDAMWLDSDDLSTDDKKIIRAFAMRHILKFTNFQYNFVSRFTRTDALPSIKHTRTRMTKLAGISPQRFDCCVNVCCCFTGKYADATHCPFCKVSRLDSRGKPRKWFSYLPFGPRLRSLYANRVTAEHMRYRERQSRTHDSTFRDYTDGKHYRTLCREHVVIDGQRQTFYYFADARDIALALSADGVCPFRNRRVSCWPLLLINLNLPPDIRYRKENVISLGVIPGPKQPHDLDSFLTPFFEEMLEFAHGVSAYDALEDGGFLLHAFLIIVFGDLQAMSKLICMKGVNGKCPCRFCNIRAIPDPAGSSKTCYVVHDRRNLPGESSFDPAHLPLRTADEMRHTGAQVDAESITNPSSARSLAKATGIKGTALLSRLPGISLPHSFPCEFMHLMWLNLIPMLVGLYSTDFKGLDEGSGEYRLTPLAWEHIGQASKAAGDTLPSAFGRRIPDLADEHGYRTAEMWSVWTMYVAPGVLRGRFRRNKYYNHFMDIARIAGLCIQLEVTQEDRTKIRHGLIKWVREFEELFYQYNPSRMSLCTSIVHYVLHIPDSIEYQGPSWVYWSFVMERHCGRITRAVRSRKQPWASLTNFVLAEAQLQTVLGLYNLDETWLVGDDDAGHQPGSLLRLPDYPTCELLAPSRTAEVDPYLAGQLANTLAVWYCSSASKEVRDSIKRNLPAQIREWGRVRRLDGGDMMHASELVAHEERDMTFVRFEQMVDKFSNRPQHESAFKREKYYGQLRRILVLPVSSKLAAVLGHTSQKAIVIAVIAECADLSKPDRHGLQFFTSVKSGSLLVEMRTVECVIGRVPTHGGKWTVVDRSDGLSRVIYNETALDTE